MNKAVSVPFRIVIPLLCIISAGLCFFISIDLGISDTDIKLISESIPTEKESGKDVSEISSENSYILNAAKDNSLSVAEMIGIHHKSKEYTDNNTALSSVISEEIKNAVNDCYYPIFAAALAAMSIIMSTGVLSVLRPGKIKTAVMSITSVMALASISTSITLVNTHTVNKLNDCRYFNAKSTPVSYIIIASYILSVILCLLYFIIFLVTNRQKKMHYIISEDNTASIVSSSNKTNNVQDVLSPVQSAAKTQIGICPAIKQTFPTVICRSGSSAGIKAVILKNSSISIGRDKAFCDIIIDSKKISRHHCEISFYERKKMFAVKDTSTNGVYTEKGVRLLKDYANLIPCGSVIYLSDLSTSILLEIK